MAPPGPIKVIAAPANASTSTQATHNRRGSATRPSRPAASLERCCQTSLLPLVAGALASKGDLTRVPGCDRPRRGARRQSDRRRARQSHIDRRVRQACWGCPNQARQATSSPPWLADACSRRATKDRSNAPGGTTFGQTTRFGGVPCRVAGYTRCLRGDPRRNDAEEVLTVRTRRSWTCRGQLDAPRQIEFPDRRHAGRRAVQALSIRT